MDGISRSILSPAGALISSLLIWLASVSVSHADEQMPVTVVIARENAVTEKIPVIGSLIAREEVQVHPFIRERAIEHILVEVGQTVKKGEPLAILDTTEARMLLDKNAVSSLRARAAIAVEMSRLDVAKVTLDEALKVVERSRALQPKGAVSQQLLDEHENAYARARAEFGLARQSLALAEADAALIGRERAEIELTIERSTVRAPEAGSILRRSARIGAITSGSADPLFVLAKDSAVEFVAKVTETSFLQLGEGMRVEITVASHDGAIDGTVRLNAAELDPATRSGEIRVELGEAKGLKPGAFARADISVSKRRNILLPGSAVKTANGRSNVFIVAGGTVGLRSVTLGIRQDGQVEILHGITDGEMIVLKSSSFLKVEEKVRPVLASTISGVPDKHLASSSKIETLEVAR
jgi:HlyD family secretion protein